MPAHPEVLLAGSPFLAPTCPLAVIESLEENGRFEIYDLTDESKRGELTVPGLKLVALCDGTLVAWNLKGSPVAVHVNEHELVGLDALQLGLDTRFKTGEGPSTSPVFITRDILKVCRELVGQDNLGVIAAEAGLGVILKEPFEVPEGVAKSTFLSAIESSVFERSEVDEGNHTEQKRFEAIKELLSKSLNALPSEIWPLLEHEKDLITICHSLARIGFAVCDGKLCHVPSKLCFALDVPDIRYLFQDPLVELARFGVRGNIENLSFSSTLARETFHRTLLSNGICDESAIVATAFNAPILARASVSGHVDVFGRDSNGSLERLFEFKFDEAPITCLAIKDTEEFITSIERTIAPYGTKECPGLAVRITSGDFAGHTGELRAYKEENSAWIVCLGQDEDQIEVEISGSMEFVAPTENSVVRVLPGPLDTQGIPRIGVLVATSGLDNISLSSYLVALGSTAAEIKSRDMHASTMQSTGPGFSLSDYNQSTPFWVMKNLVDSLGPDASKAFFDEQNAYRKHAQCLIAVGHEKNVSLFQRVPGMNGSFTVEKRLTVKVDQSLWKVVLIGDTTALLITVEGDLLAANFQENTKAPLEGIRFYPRENIEIKQTTSYVALLGTLSGSLVIVRVPDLSQSLNTNVGPNHSLVSLRPDGLAPRVVLRNSYDNSLIYFPDDESVSLGSLPKPLSAMNRLLEFTSLSVKASSDLSNLIFSQFTLLGTEVRPILLLDNPGVWKIRPNSDVTLGKCTQIEQLQIVDIPPGYCLQVLDSDGQVAGEVDIAGAFLPVESANKMTIRVVNREKETLTEHEKQGEPSFSCKVVFWGRTLSKPCPYTQKRFSKEFIEQLFNIASDIESTERLEALKLLRRIGELNGVELLVGHVELLSSVIEANLLLDNEGASDVIQIIDLLKPVVGTDTLLEIAWQPLKYGRVSQVTSKAALCDYLNVLGLLWPNGHHEAASRALTSLFPVIDVLSEEEDQRFKVLRESFGILWNVFEDELPEGTNHRDKSRFDFIIPAGTTTSGPQSTKQSFLSEVNDTDRIHFPLATLALDNRLMKFPNACSVYSTDLMPASEAERLIGRYDAGEASQSRLDLKVHSSSQGSRTTFQRNDQGSLVEVQFPDILTRNKQHMVVWDLAEVRQLTEVAVTVKFGEGQDVSASKLRNAIAVCGETFLTSPPYAGELFAYTGRDAAGVPFEIEVHAVSGAFSFDKRDGTIGVKSIFPTVAPRGVHITKGRWYYEVTLTRTAECVAQIGFCDSLFSGDDKHATGTGDDEHSWAFDGHRVKKWCGTAYSWGKKWKEGDVVGCAIDIEERQILFSLNGSWKKPMGVAFANVSIAGGIYPAVTAERSFKYRMNFGQTPFKHAPPNDSFLPVFDWILENRERAVIKPVPRLWFRRVLSADSTAQVFRVPIGKDTILARYLRLSVCMKDVISQSDQASGKMQCTVTVELRGGSSPLWVTRGLIQTIGVDEARTILHEQARTLFEEYHKCQDMITWGRKDLESAISTFEGIHRTTEQSWTYDDLEHLSNFLNLRQGNDVTEGLPPIYQAAADVFRALNEKVIKSLRRLAEIQSKLDAIRHELTYIDGSPKQPSSQSAGDVKRGREYILITMAMWLCTALVEKGFVNDKVATPSLEQMLALYKVLYVQARSAHSDGAASLIHHCLTNASDDFREALFLRLSSERQPLALVLRHLSFSRLRFVVACLLESHDLEGVVRVLEEGRKREPIELGPMNETVRIVSSDILESWSKEPDASKIQPIFRCLTHLKALDSEPRQFLGDLLGDPRFQDLLLESSKLPVLQVAARVSIGSLLSISDRSLSEPKLGSILRNIAMKTIQYDHVLTLELILHSFEMDNSSVDLDSTLPAVKQIIESLLEKDPVRPSDAPLLGICLKLLRQDVGKAVTKQGELLAKLFRRSLLRRDAETFEIFSAESVALLQSAPVAIKRELFKEYLSCLAKSESEPLCELCERFAIQVAQIFTELNDASDSHLAVQMLGTISVALQSEGSDTRMELLQTLTAICVMLLKLNTSSAEDLDDQTCLRIARWFQRHNEGIDSSNVSGLSLRRKMVYSFAQIFLMATKHSESVRKSVLQTCRELAHEVPGGNSAKDIIFQLALDMVRQSSAFSIYMVSEIVPEFGDMTEILDVSDVSIGSIKLQSISSGLFLNGSLFRSASVMEGNTWTVSGSIDAGLQGLSLNIDFCLDDEAQVVSSISFKISTTGISKFENAYVTAGNVNSTKVQIVVKQHVTSAKASGDPKEATYVLTFAAPIAARIFCVSLPIETVSTNGKSGAARAAQGTEEDIWFLKGDRVVMNKNHAKNYSDSGEVVDVADGLVIVRWTNSNRTTAIEPAGLALLQSTELLATAQTGPSQDSSEAKASNVLLTVSGLRLLGKRACSRNPLLDRPWLVALLREACLRHSSEVLPLMMSSNMAHHTQRLVLSNATSRNVALPRDLIVCLAGASEPLASDFIEAALNRSPPNEQLLPSLVELCFDDSPDVAISRSRLLLNAFRSALETAMNFPLGLARACIVVVEELGARRGLDIGITDLDALALIKNLAQRRFPLADDSLEESTCVNLLSSMLRASISARSAAANALSGLEGVSAYRLIGFLGAIGGSSAVRMALEKAARIDGAFMLEQWWIFGWAARVSKYARTWLRTSGHFAQIVHALLSSSTPLSDTMATIGLELVAAAVNFESENQVLLAQGISRALVERPNVLNAPLVDKKESIARVAGMLAQFRNNVPLIVWDLAFEVEMLGNLEHMFLSPHPTTGATPSKSSIGTEKPSSNTLQSNALSTSRRTLASLRLSPLSCGKSIDLDPNGLSATQIAVEKWGVVRSERELPGSGTSWWEIRLDYSPKGHVFVGVATARATLDGYLGCDRHGWGFIGNRGIWHNKHKESTYGKEFRGGDVVRVILNATEGTLSFALNGDHLGTAFSGLAGLKLYPAFSMYQKGDRFTIQACSLAKSENTVVINESSDLDQSAWSLLGEEEHLKWHFQSQTLSGRSGYAIPGQILCLRGSTPSVEVMNAIGKSAMHRKVRMVYKRDDTSKLEAPSAGFELSLRKYDSAESDAQVLNDKESLEDLMSRLGKDEAYIGVHVDVHL